MGCTGQVRALPWQRDDRDFTPESREKKERNRHKIAVITSEGSKQAGI